MNLRRKIFESIIDHLVRWKYTPTRSEIRKLFAGLTEDVDLHLEQLEREGLISLESDCGEQIAVQSTYVPAPCIKLREGFSVGEAESESHIGMLTLDLRGVGVMMEQDLYALRVYDNAMSDAGIFQGDIVILTHASPARGDVVAVEIGGRIVLRRYILPSGIPHLLAENPLRPELTPALDLPIHGIFWGLIRTEPRLRPLVKPTDASGRGLKKGESESLQWNNFREDMAMPVATSPWVHRVSSKGQRQGKRGSARRTASHADLQKKQPTSFCSSEHNDRIDFEYVAGSAAGSAADKARSVLERAVRNYERNEKKRGKKRQN